ncbi:hypothetical protein KFL_004380090 [Klebsormidium nitens]|uniref:Uncharacterized protein n=1 Tax=Klebsormidium nitens TaxID=105231 RepID=A0A1Y1IGB2_KLENI|nr:hypothetical protein KFL_004380090 [Klebsormidium nitens]|eukprot:GAQ88549.1 hypothetical protein KFL_004380090 [Klebsormidium nitens]
MSNAAPFAAPLVDFDPRQYEAAPAIALSGNSQLPTQSCLWQCTDLSTIASEKPDWVLMLCKEAYLKALPGALDWATSSMLYSGWSTLHSKELHYF